MDWCLDGVGKGRLVVGFGGLGDGSGERKTCGN